MSDAISNGPQTLTGNSLSANSMYKPAPIPSWVTNGGNTPASTGFSSTSQTSSDPAKLLTDAYAGINDAYNPSATVAMLQRQSSGAIDTANRASSNAATEYAYRDMLSGGNASGAGAMKAQIQLLGLDKANQYETQAAQTSDKAMQDASAAKLSAAAQYGNIQNSYLATLATSYANMQNNATQQAQIAATKNNALLQANTAIATSNNNPALRQWQTLDANGQPAKLVNGFLPAGTQSVYTNPNPLPFFT